MDGELSRSDIQFMIDDTARQTKLDAERYTDDVLKSAREDWRTADADIKEGINDWSEKLRELEQKQEELRTEFKTLDKRINEFLDIIADWAEPKKEESNGESSDEQSSQDNDTGTD